MDDQRRTRITHVWLMYLVPPLLSREVPPLLLPPLIFLSEDGVSAVPVFFCFFP